MAHLSHDELLRQVDDYAGANDMADNLPLLRKGALAAQESNFESIVELTEEDKEALRQETNHKWRQTGALYLTIIMCSVGAAVQ